MSSTFSLRQRWFVIMGIGLLVPALIAAGLFWLSPQVAAAATATRDIAEARLDYSGNKFVDALDGRIARSAWLDVRETGDCLPAGQASRDLNGDGCVTVADVQAVVNHIGSATDSAMVEAVLSPEALAGSGATLTVITTTYFLTDVNPGDGQCLTYNGTCSLVAAIQESNVLTGHETINFDIRPGGVCPTVAIIAAGTTAGEIAGPLLVISDATNAGVTIDGYTQCGSSPNTSPLAGNAVLKVEVRGNRRTLVKGFFIDSDNNVLKGMAVYHWNEQFRIDGGDDNLIEGNFAGTNAAQNSSPAYGNGIDVEFGSRDNIVGGAAPSARNVVNGNNADAMRVSGNNTQFNQILGNFIGVKQDGRTRGTNTADGIDLSHGARYNTFGGVNPGERNVISGNSRDGIEVSHPCDATVCGVTITTGYNTIVNNFIGVSVTGTTALGNGNKGITLEELIEHMDVYSNVISNQGYSGMRMDGCSSFNDIHHNYIGVAPDGVTAMGNGTTNNTVGQSGVQLQSESQGNLVRHNIIANNGFVSGTPDDDGYGVKVTRDAGLYADCTETLYNTISQNSIYNNGGLGIKLDVTGGITANQGITAPVMIVANPIFVAGTACPNCLVEVFISDKFLSGGAEPAGEGKTFIGSGTADAGGNFSINLTGTVNILQLVTGTSTDANGNTSEFANNVYVVDPPPATATPTQTDTPSLTPSVTATSSPTNTPSATATATASSTATPSATPTTTQTPTLTRTSTPTRTFTPSATATMTATPSRTATASRTPTATATTASSNRKLYLPVILR